ncbi:ribosome silencing factor [Hyphomicrobiales bacterium]|nr:ribosome silencing factor [Hyphomicrobiales bacterium]
MSKKLLKEIISNLDDNKAQDITSIPMEGKSDIADHLVIATGTSSRHVSSLAQRIVDNLKDYGLKRINAEGLEKGDWVLIDGGDIIVHLFREEVRDFYDLEKLWSPSLELNSNNT